MNENGITYLLWQDMVGVTRTRGVPTRDLQRRAEAGLGWAMAGQALTPFGDIVDNPWGPMDEARQIPDFSTQFLIPGNGESLDLRGVICDGWASLDEPWDCCVRSFCRNALTQFKAATGCSLVMAWEHEFMLSGDDKEPEIPFSFSAARRHHAVLTEIEAALTAAGVPIETVEPEYGSSQYEVASGPEAAQVAADHAVITREVIREIAERRGLRATLTPKVSPDAVGNGAHVHFSFSDAGGRNVTADPNSPSGLSQSAAAFCAGILRHLDALVAITAPSPVSYARLGPHHWSCGFSAIGVQNREVALRIIPGISADPEKSLRSFNVEYRPLDATASPYFAVGMMIRAGLQGIAEGYALPKLAASDPADMTEAERAEHGITPLPETLSSALDALEADVTAKSWFSDHQWQTYLAIKRREAADAEDDPDGSFGRYANAY